MNLSGISYDLRAFHTDPIMDEGRHEHTWTVWYYWPMDPWRDKRAMYAALRTVCEGLAPETPAFQRELPPDLWDEETIATAVMALLTPKPACVRVERPGSEVVLWG